MPVFRIYVEKKPGFDIHAAALLDELKNIFGLSKLKGVRVLNRYDVEGLDKTHLDAARRTVFAEPQLDSAYLELPGGYDFALFVEYLPGQFDQRADSCAQCLQILTGGERPTVRTACVYLFDCGGAKLSADDEATIRRHLINPVECREASPELPDTLEAASAAPPRVPTLDEFLRLADADLTDFCKRYGLAMDTDDLAFCREYFAKEGRAPTLTELRVIDTYWSDHCRHTTFLTHLEDIQIEDASVRRSFDLFLRYKNELGRGGKPITLMEIATLGARALKQAGLLDSLDESEEINACSVRIAVDEDGKDNDWLLMFKNETHNHPTEIEPFGGAATCIGGAIRDPLSGRSYVYQAMRVTGAGDPTVRISETLPGKLPQRVITTKAAHGYSSYGNQIGLATGLVREVYHPGYVAKRMEVGAVIGAAPVSNVKRYAPEAGDIVILLGGRTGRDGCGGATGSSKSHSVESLQQCGAEVQKGNAPEERKIQRLFRNPDVTRLIRRCNDFGAGGVSVAVGELADGLVINLDAVPKKYDGLDGTELAISESQERMAVVVSPSDVDAFVSFAAAENLEATIIAEVTAEPRLVMKWNGQTIVDISREFLNTNGSAKRADIFVDKLTIGSPNVVCEVFPYGENAHPLSPLEKHFINIVSDLNVCSQKGLVERFDSTVGAGTVLMPFGGKHQMTPAQTMAAKLPVCGAKTDTCSLMSFAFYPDLSERDPYAAAYLAVASSVAKVIAAGGSLSRCWLSFQEYFERPGSDPKRWGKPFAALLGAFQAQIDLGIAAIGGKDSMSGSFENLDVPPTLISFAVSTANVASVVSGEFKRVGSEVALMAPCCVEGGVPSSSDLRDMYLALESMVACDLVLSAYVVEGGGIGEAVIKMAAGNRIGFEFDKAYTDLSILTGYRMGNIIVELEGSKPLPAGVRQCTTLGRTVDKYAIALGGESVDLLKLQWFYEKRLHSVFPTTLDRDGQAGAGSVFGGDSCSGGQPDAAHTPAVISGKPRVLIPVFPGTNCEYDTAAAFDRCGSLSEIIIVKNLSPSDIEQSVRMLVDAISRSQVVAFPGGFSGGDEPDGSAKFIVSFFKNPRVKDAVAELLGRRDGLMLGICNGFQALIKLGLVPYGEIVDTFDNSPTLTFNTIGRHQSMLVSTRIVSTASPWLCGFDVGNVHTLAISHGEGRFVAPQAVIDELFAKGQVATQYVDLSGEPSMELPFNPNGSMCAIEGILSPDGRILGKMGHNERSGEGLLKNVPGADTAPLGIFEAPARYFG